MADMENVISPSHQNGEREPGTLLTVEDLARLAKVTVPTVYGWNKRGTAPRRLRVGRYVRYRQSDVVAWLDERVAAGEAAA
jgi:predicted DNA-binding transcriptional regulator AlpA